MNQTYEQHGRIVTVLDERVQDLYVLIEYLGALWAHGEPQEELRAQGLRINALLNELREAGAPMATIEDDARGIGSWAAAHVQDLVQDRDPELAIDGCRRCGELGLTRKQRDAITSSLGHTPDELEQLTQL